MFIKHKFQCNPIQRPYGRASTFHSRSSRSKTRKYASKKTSRCITFTIGKSVGKNCRESNICCQVMLYLKCFVQMLLAHLRYLLDKNIYTDIKKRDKYRCQFLSLPFYR